MTPKHINTLGNNLNSNTSIANHPFIWGNIALIAGVPWLLALSMAGLAVGDPVFPAWLEILLLASPAIAAAAWLHWQQPFSPFSLWFLVKPSESLNEDELRVLTLLKQQRNGWYVTGWIAVAVGFVMSGIFCKLYVAAPLAQAIAPFPAGLRLFGIIWAEVFFFLSNVLLQSGVSALRIKLTAESEITSLQPFTIEKIKNNFTNIGWQVPQLLKFFEEEPASETVEKRDAPQVTEPEQPQDIEEIAIAVQEESNISEFAVDDLVEITTEDEINLSEELTTDEPTQIDSEVVVTIHDDTLEIVDSLVDESANESIEEIEVIPEVNDSNAVLNLEEVTETKFTSDEVTNNLVEEFIEVSEELEVDEAIAEVCEALDINEVVAESELETSEDINPEDVNDNDFIEPTAKDLEQEKFDETELATIVDIVEDAPKSESHEVSEDALDTSSDISDVKLDIQEVANNVNEDVLDSPVTDTISEIELNESSDSVDEETPEVNLNSPFADLTEELVDDDFDADTNEEITDPADTALEIVEPELEAIASVIDEPNTEISTITESEDELDAPTRETVDDVIIKTEINDSIDTDTETKKQKSNKSIDLFKKSRKKGFAQKKYGFGKSAKPNITNEIDADQVEVSIEDDDELEIGDIISEAFVESRFEVYDANLETQEIVEEPNDDLVAEVELETEPEIEIEAIADGSAVELDIQGSLPIEQLEISESKPSDFDDELDELITFNAYVENILQDYLGDSSEESDFENQEFKDIQEVEDIMQITSVSEQATDIAEEVLVAKESLETSIPELIEPPAPIEPPVEAIAQTSETSSEELQDEPTPHKDPKYLVQEFLLDKFLAKLEELNNADKSTTKSNLEAKPEVTEVADQDTAASLINDVNDENLESEQDEFADLEALLNRNIPEENQELI